MYLSELDRKEAPHIYTALQKAKAHFVKAKSVSEALQVAKAHIESNTNGKIDYIEFLSYPDLAEINEQTTKFLVAAAVYIGKTRLIDNIMFELEGDTTHV